MRSLLLSLVALVATAALVDAQMFRRAGGSCGPGGCSASSCASGECAEPASLVGDDYKWHGAIGSDDEIYLYLGKRQIGAYRYSTGTYLPIVGNSWGEACEPPIPPPGAVAKGAPTTKLPTGVEWDKLSHVDKYERSGKASSKKEVIETLAADSKLTDDSAHWHASVFCKDASKRKQITDSLKSSPDFRKFRVQSYNPDDKVSKAMLQSFNLDKDERFRQSGFMIVIQPPEDKEGTAPAYPVYSWNGPGPLIQSLRSQKGYDPNGTRALDGQDANYLPLLAAAPILLLVGRSFTQRSSEDADEPDEPQP